MWIRRLRVNWGILIKRKRKKCEAAWSASECSLLKACICVLRKEISDIRSSLKLVNTEDTDTVARLAKMKCEKLAEKQNFHNYKILLWVCKRNELDIELKLAFSSPLKWFLWPHELSNHWSDDKHLLISWLGGGRVMSTWFAKYYSYCGAMPFFFRDLESAFQLFICWLAYKCFGKLIQ